MKALTWIVLFSVFMLPGCSYLTVQKAPKEVFWDDVKYSECTSQKGTVVVDTIFSVSTGVAVLMGQVISVLPFLAWVSSALYGNAEVENCKKFLEYKATKKAATEAAPPPSST